MVLSHEIKVLLTHEDVFNNVGSDSFVIDFINSVPSKTLLNYLSNINFLLFLNHNVAFSRDFQIKILKKFINNKRNKDKIYFDSIVSVVERNLEPIVFCRYTNLIFINKVLKNLNFLQQREFDVNEKSSFIDCYLIFNSETIKSTNSIDLDKLKSLDDNGLNDLMITTFIHQSDFGNKFDVSCQFVRSFYFFSFLEGHEDFKYFISGYYEKLAVNSFKEMLLNLNYIWISTNYGQPNKQATCLIDFSGKDSYIGLNLKLINSLCFSGLNQDYDDILNFKGLRNSFLFNVIKSKYLILDINFFFDWIYKSQVFLFKEFIESKGFRGDFMSKKSELFMERNYFNRLMNACFSSNCSKFITRCAVKLLSFLTVSV